VSVGAKTGKAKKAPKYDEKLWKKVDCHKGAVVVDKIGSVTVFAGGWSRDLVIPPHTLVIDLTGREAPAAFSSVKDVSVSGWADYDIISLPVKDFGTPHVDAGWWSNFASQVIQHCLTAGQNVLVCCDGGHGRTGTILAILLWHWKGQPDIDMVSWVRRNYCEFAVETPAQEKYVAACTNG
jgi:hypothetical protein